MEAAPVEQGMPGGPVPGEEGGPFDRTERDGTGEDGRGGHHHLLGVAALPHEAHHRLTDGHLLHARADGRHPARHLEPGNERGGRFHLVAARQHQQVGEVHPRRLHVDQHRPRPRPRVGNLGPGEVIHPAEPAAHHRPHRRARLPAQLTRAASTSGSRSRRGGNVPNIAPQSPATRVAR